MARSSIGDSISLRSDSSHALNHAWDPIALRWGRWCILHMRLSCAQEKWVRLVLAWTITTIAYQKSSLSCCQSVLPAIIVITISCNLVVPLRCCNHTLRTIMIESIIFITIWVSKFIDGRLCVSVMARLKLLSIATSEHLGAKQLKILDLVMRCNRCSISRFMKNVAVRFFQVIATAWALT